MIKKNVRFHSWDSSGGKKTQSKEKMPKGPVGTDTDSRHILRVSIDSQKETTFPISQTPLVLPPGLLKILQDSH